MAIGENADHQEAAVPGAEVAAEGAEDLVAVSRPIDVVDHGLADVAEGRRHGERHVLQGQNDLLAVARQATVAFGGQDRHRAGIGGGEIPRWCHGVDRAFVTGWPRHHREAGDGVDGVVDMGTAVAGADDVERDKVGAPPGEFLIGKPTTRRHVGGEDTGAFARRGDKCG